MKYLYLQCGNISSAAGKTASVIGAHCQAIRKRVSTGSLPMFESLKYLKPFTVVATVFGGIFCHYLQGASNF